MNQCYPRTRIVIDLDAVVRNYRSALSLTDSTVTCVIKSNAYGHGADIIGETLYEAGCRSFSVSSAREALALRPHVDESEILVMGVSEKCYLPQLLKNHVAITVATFRDLQDTEEAAADSGITAEVQLKINTGFYRLGFDSDAETGIRLAEAVKSCPHVHAGGMFSHLGLVTQERDIMQHDNLMRMHSMLAENGVEIDDVHICDSIGLVRYPAFHHSRVRVGALLFGVRPYRSEHMPYECLRALTFETQITQLHHAAKGEVVGYGDDMVLERDSLIATLPVGYGDGYPRKLSNAVGQVSIRGCRAPVVGLVCMDQMMVDVTDIPGVQEDDTATLLGGDISFDEYSSWCKTNRNECITILSRRPVRVYLKNGEVFRIRDELLGI